MALRNVAILIEIPHRHIAGELLDSLTLAEYIVHALAVFEEFETVAAFSPGLEAELRGACPTWHTPNCSGGTLHALAATLTRLHSGVVHAVRRLDAAVDTADLALRPVPSLERGTATEPLK